VLAKPNFESQVRIGSYRQVIREHLCVDVRVVGGMCWLLELLPVNDEHGQDERRHGSKEPAVRQPSGHTGERASSHHTSRGLMPMSPFQRCFAGRTKPIDDTGRDVIQATVKALRDPFSKILFVHKEIPFDFRKSASAWVSREQWVFTLPSEQPITCAVSETSSSSQ